MTISIITNEKHTSLFTKFIQTFAFDLTNISNCILVNNTFVLKEVIKNNTNNKKLTLFPYKDYLNNELKIQKNNFYVFSASLFSLNKELHNSDIILIFVNLNQLDEHKMFKLLKKINQYKINNNKSIFIPWCNELNDANKINAIYLNNLFKNNLMDQVFELNKYHDKEFINAIIKKIREL